MSIWEPKLFVSNIPHNVNEDILRDLFQPYGEIRELSLYPKKGSHITATIRYLPCPSGIVVGVCNLCPVLGPVLTVTCGCNS